MTKFLKKSEIKSNWIEIDAKNAVVGRLATIITKILRGKNKNTFSPHVDHGDYVIVKNVEKIKFTGSKFQNKNVVGAGFVINLPDLGGLKKLEDLGIKSKYLIEF